ncbi:2-oxo acid dehydrogenase subunit E2 [Mycoplasmopsis cynos]|uniref:Pyruvate dehydrogenase E2 component (Dihydrolipoamide acetyltransferase) n=1 Tax=Mycoplasmopsis cynos TaxID=171284 RepID=A0A449AII6_9BACT|nr:2-oxo acid dehydrogenase subunit E2 [Mycoplasmopsis cynos]TQC54871.1 dihydrolipoamide acetyltransferase [Mycoplasmopsis cynos]VEU64828.1 pyruvate dehydrogenase E2 component (dihydrolipoamide acetyltransferase) [Mycoplasmopsis cynos]
MQKILSTPLARALAAKLGINIEQVTGTGPQGRILKADILAFTEHKPNEPMKVLNLNSQPRIQTAMNATPLNPIVLDGKRVKVTSIRKTIAKAMINSKNNVAYFSLVNEIDVSHLWDLRKSIVEDVLKTTGVKLTFLPYIAKAIIVALKEFPILAAKYDELTSEIVYPTTINLGIAADTIAGLMVPVIKDSQNLTIIDLAKEISRLALAAREKTIKSNEMSGGSFTITNYGSIGALFGTPVINYPELAIAGVGAIIDKPIVKNGQIVPGKVMNLTVSADHRWIDGATVGRFLLRIKELLEKPEILGVL